MKKEKERGREGSCGVKEDKKKKKRRKRREKRRRRRKEIDAKNKARGEGKEVIEWE